MKKLFSVILCISMVMSAISLFPFTASAVESGTCGDDLTWSFDSLTGTLTISGSGDMYDYASSADVPWYSLRSQITAISITDDITSVSYNALSICTSIGYNTYDNAKYIGNESNPYVILMAVTRETVSSCVIHEDTRVIGAWAFCDCIRIKRIDIPERVTSIEVGAFANCTKLASVSLPGGLIYIKSIAFSNCTALSEIIFPCSVRYLGEYAFRNCSSLSSVFLPDGISVIPESVFKGCSSISTLSIPENLELIEEGAFNGCDQLTDIYYGGSEVSWDEIDMDQNTADLFDSAVIHFNGRCGSGLIWTFDEERETLTIVGSGDMYNFDDTSNRAPWYEKRGLITTVNLPENTTSIGAYSFSGLTGISDIVIPARIKEIGESAFSGCSSLNDVRYTGTPELWDGISIAVGNEPLTNSTIHYVDFGACGESVFWTYDLESHKLLISGFGDMANYSSSASYPWHEYGSEIVSIDIAEGVTSIGDYAFLGCSSLVNMSLPESLGNIGVSSIPTSSSLTYITFGNAEYLGNANNPYVLLVKAVETATSCNINANTKIISYYAFADCMRLRNIVIPDGVTTICSGAFANCSRIQEINIPASVTEISGNIFMSCSSLSSITVDPNNVIYHSRNNCIIERATGVLIAGCKSSVIPVDGSITEIGQYAFFGSSLLTEINVPESVMSIGQYAFQNCRSLTSIDFPSNLLSIGQYAFCGCSEIKNVEVPGSISVLENNTFMNCSSLNSVILPNSVRSVENSAFNGCTSLSRIFYSGTETEFNNINVDNNNGGNFNFLNASIYYDFAKSGTCGDSLTWTLDADRGSLVIFGSGNMTDFASAQSVPWYPCRELISTVTLASGITSIGEWAFYGFSALSDVYFDGTEEDFANVSVSENNDVLSAATVHFAGAALCGDSLIWSVDPENGVLTISGVGEMYDFTSENDIPWYRDRERITSVVIMSGVTSIGAFAFSGCGAASVIIPGDVLTVGSSSLSACSSLADIYYGGTQTEWENIGMSVGERDAISNVTVHYGALCGEALVWSFDENTGMLTIEGSGDMTDFSSPVDVPWQDFALSVSSVSLPSGITSVGSFAFYGCSSLTDVYYDGDESAWANVNIDNTQGANDSLLCAAIHYTYTVIYDAVGGTGAPASQKKAAGVPLTLDGTHPEKSYTITYNANGGTVSPSQVTVFCTFNGWNTAQDGTGTHYAPGDTYTVDAGVTLFAEWTDPQAGNLAVPYHDVYTFDGWYTATAGGQRVTDAAVITSDITLYALWGYYLDSTEVYAFSNSKTNFGTTYSVYDSDFLKLCDYVRMIYKDDAKTAGSVINNIQKYRNSDWGGSCYGMSVTTLLDKTGQIEFNGNFDPDAATMHDVTPPANNPDVENAINYYHIAQYIPYLRSENCSTYSKSKTNWSEGLAELVSRAQDGVPMLFCYRHSRSAHAIVIKGYRQGTDGSHNLIAYDNRYPKRDITIKIDKNYYSCVVNGNEDCTSVEFTGNLAAFDAIDIDGPENDWANFTLVVDDEPGGQGTDPVDDTAQITIKSKGRVVVVNAEGETLTFDNGDYSGSMEVEDDYFTVVDDEAQENNFTFTYTVPNSASFDFLPEDAELYVSVVSADIYASTETIGAEHVLVSKDDGICAFGESVVYTLSLSVNDGACDMISISGISDGDVTLENEGERLMATGIDTEQGIVTVYSNTVNVDAYTYAPGYPTFTVIELSDNPGDIAIMGSTNEDGVYDINIGISYSGCQHTWDGGVESSLPTYTEDGVRTYTCERCGNTRTKAIPKMISDFPGDSNGDGKVNAKDITQIKMFISGTADIDVTYQVNADVNGDGKINAKDITLIKRAIAGLI